MTSRADSLTFEPTYDMSIHQNTDAKAWAKFFVETWNKLGKPEPDEAWMLGWFANAMMAMYDAYHNKDAAEIERLRAALAEVHLTINALYTERDKARAALAEAQRELKSECERRDEIIISTTKLWNDVEADNIKLRAELNETSRLAYEWMICHDKLKAGEPYTFPSPPYNKTIDDLRAALAEAREVMQRIASLLPGGRDGLDDDHHVLISQLTMGDLRRAAKWLEANPAP